MVTLHVQVCTLWKMIGSDVQEKCFKSTEQVARERYVLEILLGYIILMKADGGWAAQEMNVGGLHVLDNQLLRTDLLRRTTGTHVVEKCLGFMPMEKVTTLSLTQAMMSFFIMWMLTPGYPFYLKMPLLNSQRALDIHAHLLIACMTDVTMNFSVYGSDSYSTMNYKCLTSTCMIITSRTSILD